MHEVRRRWSIALITALILTAGTPAQATPPRTAGGPRAVTSALDDLKPVGAAQMAASDEGVYVTRVYRDLFHRTPDPEGLATWVAALGSGAAREAVANSITGSDEYRSRLITAAYDHYLGRGPDTSGLQFWLGQMRSGVHIEQMTAGFLASEEFFARGGSTAPGWVTLLYQTVLDRSPGASETAWWVGAIAAGADRGAVARGFLYSTEHLSSVVDDYYVNLLGRHLDPSGQATWVGLIQSGHRDEEIIAAIVSSAEYRQLAARGDRAVRLGASVSPPACLTGRIVDGGVSWPSPLPAGIVSVELYRADRLVARGPTPQGLAPWTYTLRVHVAAGYRLVDEGARLDPSGDYLLPATVPAFDGICTSEPYAVLTVRTTPQTCVGGSLVGGAIGWDLPLPSGIRWVEVQGVSVGPADSLGPGTYTLRVTMLPGVQLLRSGAVDQGGGVYTIRTTVAASSDPSCRHPAPSVRVGLGLGGAEPNGHAINIAISGDGSWVAFDSDSSNLVAGDDNGVRDVFVTNVATGQTLLVSRTADGSPAAGMSHEPSISADGRWAAFSSYAHDLPGGSYAGQVYLWDRNDGSVTLVSRAADGSPARASSSGASISADGRWVTFFSDDTHLVEGGDGGSYVFDRVTGTVTSSPVGSAAAYSVDRRWFAYAQPTSNAVLWDSATDTRRLLLTGADASVPVVANAVSQDGRWVAFTARASALVPTSTNRQDTVFLWDAATGQYAPVALGSSGGPSDGKSTFFGMSADGTRLVYVSYSSDIPGGSRTGLRNAAWYDRTTGRTTIVGVGPGGVMPNEETYHAAMSADGHVIAYTSNATNLVPGGTNGLTDVFVTRLD